MITRRVATLISAAMVVTASCASSPTAPSAATTGPVRGGRLVVAWGDPSNLDPFRVSDDPSEGFVARQIYEPLVDADPQTGEYKPGLARWTVGADGRTYAFEIAANATWSDGQPILADDVLTSIKLYARSKTKINDGREAIREIAGYRDYRDGKAAAISGIRASGKRLEVQLDRAFCAFLSLFLLLPPVPTHVFGRYLSDTDPSLNADQAPEQLAPPVSSGPFLFKQWRHGEELVLGANGRYWRGRPLLDELAFRVLDPAAGMAPFRSGVVQLGWGGARSGLYANAAEFERDPSLSIRRIADPGYTFIGWNTRSETAPALQDKRIRQALAYGLDAGLLIERILDGEGVPIRQHADRTSWGRTDGLNTYVFDPAKAEELIRAVGYTKGPDGYYQKDGRALAFTMTTNDNNQVRAKVLQLAVDQYRAIGVRVTPQREVFAGLTRRLTDGDPSIEAFVAGWAWRADPFGALVWHSGPKGTVSGGLVNYTDPRLDAALDAFLLGPDCSVAKRKGAFEVLDRMLNEDQPYNFLFQANTVFVASSRLRGFTPGSYVPAPDSHLWWLAREK